MSLAGKLRGYGRYAAWRPRQFADWGRDRERRLATCLLRRLVKRRTVTLIAEDCWGGDVYRSIGMPYMSPFVGVWVSRKGYLDLVAHLPERLSEPLRFEANPRFAYPVARLGESLIGFKHYRSKEEVVEKWERRKRRISLDNVRVKIDLRRVQMDDEVDRWNEMALPGSLAFVSEETLRRYGPVHNALPVPETETFLQTVIESRKAFLLWRWLNEGTVCRGSRLPRLWNRALVRLFYQM